MITVGAAVVVLAVVLGINWVRGGGEKTWRVVPYVGGIPTGPAPMVGQVAPDFEISVVDVTTKEVSTFRLSDQKGKVVWLNFWASWCPPCRAEMPDIQKVWDEVRGKDVVLVAIAFGEPYEDSISYMVRNKFTIPVGLDPGSKLATEYRLAGLPTHFFIDKEGILREIRIGLLSDQGIRQRLEKAGAK